MKPETVEFMPTVHDALLPMHARLNARTSVPVIGPKGLCEGRTLAICGAGPSLVQPEGYDEVWAANRATHSVDCTHAVCIDPAPDMREVWADPPDVVYFLASIVDPRLVAHLLGRGRRLAFFHSIQTGDGESEAVLYARLFPKTALTATGMNVIGRAVDLALWLGYSRVALYGCDMAFGSGHEMYADGRRYAGGWWLMAEIDGVVWRTKADMLLTAIALARLSRDRPELWFQPDTLPYALRDQPDEVLYQEWHREEAA